MYSLAWHPTKEGILAFGTSEGVVAIADVFYSQKEPSVFKHGHQKKVYKLTWGPPFSKDPENKDVSNPNELYLFSVGNKCILQRDPTKPSSEPLNLIDVANFPDKNLSDAYWKPDFSLLAVGCENGYICMLKPSTPGILCVFEPYKKLIQSLNWHPIATTADINTSTLQGYITCGSVDADPVVKVWNCFAVDDTYTVKQVAALKGHKDFVQFVSWSPHIAGQLVSSSADYTVKIWDVTTQSMLASFEFGFSLPLFCMWSPIDPDIMICGVANKMMVSWRISSAPKDRRVIKEFKFRKGNAVSNASNLEGNAAEGTEGGGGPEKAKEVLSAELKEAGKTKSENKLFRKARFWSEIKTGDFYELLKGKGDDSKELEFLVPFLGSENHLEEWLSAEKEFHEKANNWNEFTLLSLVRGRGLKEMIEEKIQSGHVDEFLISLAPSVSLSLWREACCSYSKILAEKKLYRKAAAYLIAVEKTEEAIKLLVDAKLYEEALCIARCHLPLSDPVIPEIIRNYAAHLSNSGSFLKACECYVYLDDFSAVENILGKKKKAEYLSLAAYAAKRAGSEDREVKHAKEALLACMENLDWELGARICSDHSNLKELSVLYRTHHLLHQANSGELILEKGLIPYLKEVLEVKEDSSLYSSLLYVHDKNAFCTDLNQLFLTLARELSLACYSVDEDLFLTHIIRALNAASRFFQPNGVTTSPLYKLCSWLSPNGYFAADSLFSWREENFGPKIKSIRAFLGQGILQHAEARASGNERTDGRKFDCADFEVFLRELIDDMLDAEAFEYFANQIAFTSTKKEFISAYSRASDPGTEKEDRAENVGKEGSGEDSADPPKTEDSVSGCESREADADQKIADMKEKINVLPKKIEDFEGARVMAPNPTLMYFAIVNKCEFSKEGVENDFLEVVNSKWKKLQGN